MRTSVVVVMLLMTLNGASAPACGDGQKVEAPKQGNAAATPTAPRAEEKVLGGEIKTLAEGSYGRVNDAFLVVARDPEVYAELRKLAGELPELGADFFKTGAVVGAFLGTRRSGGYGVEVARDGEGSVRVAEKSPPPGAMTTQALTSPFKVVSVPSGDWQALQVHPAGAWGKSSRPYRVTGGEFTTGGGIAGRTEQLRLEGGLRVMRRGALATLVFDIKGTGGKAGRSLTGAATGVVRPDGGVTIPLLDAGALVDHPRSPLRATGRFGDGEGKLTLVFESLPSRVADGFGGLGKLEAEATGPPPKKSESDEPDAM